MQALARWARTRAPWLLVAGVVLPLAAWLVAILAVTRLRFVVVADPTVQVGVEAAAALARLFGALVLWLFPDERAGRRLRWVAAGLVVLGLGGLLFGYLPPLFRRVVDLGDLNRSLYASLAVWSLAGALFAVGLLPATPPPLTRRVAGAVGGVFAACAAAIALGAGALPPLTHLSGLAAAARDDTAALHGLTPWHWALSLIPLGLALAAAVGAARRPLPGALGRWLAAAMALLVGAQLHNLCWPSAYSTVLTTANLLRLAFAVAVTAGAILELRRVAAERAALLAAERETTRRLEELAALKAAFTAMVAHELGSPLAAIRAYTDMLATGEFAAAGRAAALAAIQAEAGLLTALVADVQAAATVERDDFALRPRPTPLGALLADAAAFARALPGAHPLTVAAPDDEAWVLADPERIGQVLRNLLGNAAHYAPDGAPIALRARRAGRRVRIEVADEGYGIHPDDLPRIFEKFGRGRDRAGHKVAGMGLGLYLSRRIVRAHGADLAVTSAPRAGSVFAFDLEVAG
ncbi:MAG TPA: HAMP domain-containing sensor histidine kinase [Thermomicrobiales bacterium]|nr:HAMP domain-containing sensor histidine kinase [Thermomicrobiales bacterium]